MIETCNSNNVSFNAQIGLYLKVNVRRSEDYYVIRGVIFALFCGLTSFQV